MRGILLFLAFLSSVVTAQPLIKHNLYPFNPDYSNPAATGLSGCLEMNATDMHQWIGIPDAPNVQSLSIQKGFSITPEKKKNGVGINLIRDSNGPQKLMNGELLYSFQVQIGKGSTWLGMGLSGEVQQMSIDESGFTPVFDPEITGSIQREITYNASAGMYLFNDRNFGGLAVYNLLPVSTATGYGGESFFLSIQGGHIFPINKNDVLLQSSVQVFAGKSIYQFDLNNRLKFRNNLWGGLTLRKYLGPFQITGQNILLFAGYDFNSWSFCYNYNFDINGTQFHHYGTHLLSISYRLCSKNIACPAYR